MNFNIHTLFNIASNLIYILIRNKKFNGNRIRKISNINNIYTSFPSNRLFCNIKNLSPYSYSRHFTIYIFKFNNVITFKTVSIENSLFLISTESGFVSGISNSRLEGFCGIKRRPVCRNRHILFLLFLSRNIF